MALEDTLAAWTVPSSDTEQQKQERTERMIREAVAAHKPFLNCRLSIYAKGSYANNTNVRADSDVDVAVECTEAEHWEEAEPGIHTPGSRMRIRGRRRSFGQNLARHWPRNFQGK